jgi:hypothetical protein
VEFFIFGGEVDHAKKKAVSKLKNCFTISRFKPATFALQLCGFPMGGTLPQQVGFLFYNALH